MQNLKDAGFIQSEKTLMRGTDHLTSLLCGKKYMKERVLHLY